MYASLRLTVDKRWRNSRTALICEPTRPKWRVVLGISPYIRGTAFFPAASSHSRHNLQELCGLSLHYDHPCSAIILTFHSLAPLTISGFLQERQFTASSLPLCLSTIQPRACRGE
ncbi:hypothetical protein BJX68DRAFT_150036 [Aspergillus pseudodeflectus]|uniref:Uncharacterized protein n=1 Tax=Aspergillus pseudodeflectus TaxID=176178 RepID=A0ABR4JVZ0_9EURO